MLYDMTSLQAVNGSVSQACHPEYTLANGQPHSGMYCRERARAGAPGGCSVRREYFFLFFYFASRSRLLFDV